MNEGVNRSSQRLEALAENLSKAFSGKGCDVITDLGEVTLIVPSAELLEVATELRDGEAFAFEELIDVCGVDYYAYGRSEWATDDASSSGFGRGTVRGGAGPDIDQNDICIEFLEMSNEAFFLGMLEVRRNKGFSRPRDEPERQGAGYRMRQVFKIG